MTTSILSPQAQNLSVENSIQPKIEQMIDELAASLPDPGQLTSDQRRGMIARYTAVLEANFIYWMAATLISVKSEGARPHLLENLFEEVRDAHPVMLRRFAIAAHAFPRDTDALVVDEDLTKVRKFLGKLSATQSLATMAFFEGFIQKFMAYLADLATLQGSTDMEYTDVHGVCDIEHTQGLFTALSEEMEVNPLNPDADIFEGVYLLRTLVQTIVFGQSEIIAA
jgi:DNA-binding Lrp family transcriptional regulator